MLYRWFIYDFNNLGTVNLGEDDHKNKVILDLTVDKIIVAKKDGEGEDVEDCSNKNKDGGN